MIDTLPTFPPLLSGHRISSNEQPLGFARAGAASGELGAGDLVWSEETNRLRFALVCEPDVPRDRCIEILFVTMVAAGDAIGALVPPEISVTYQWPSVLLMNDARFGFADLVISDEETDGIPDWMAVSLDVQMMPDFVDPNPGETADITTMWDEGCGDVTRNELLESIARHTVALIHTWSEDGFSPIHQQWMGRLFTNQKMAGAVENAVNGGLVGLDESGNAILSGDKDADGFPVLDALDVLRRDWTKNE